MRLLCGALWSCFALLVSILCAVKFVNQYFTFRSDEIQYGLAVIAVIAFIAFLYSATILVYSAWSNLAREDEREQLRIEAIADVIEGEQELEDEIEDLEIDDEEIKDEVTAAE